MPPPLVPPHLRGKTRANSRNLQRQAKNLETYTRRSGRTPTGVLNMYGNNISSVSSTSNQNNYGSINKYTGINYNAVANQPYNPNIYKTANYMLRPPYNPNIYGSANYMLKPSVSPTFQRPNSIQAFGNPTIRNKYVLPQHKPRLLPPNARLIRRSRKSRKNVR